MPRGLSTLSPVGSPEREELVADVRSLKAAGLTHTEVANELMLDVSQVALICKQNAIPSAWAPRGGRWYAKARRERMPSC